MAITGYFESTVDLDRGVRLTPMNQLFAAADGNALTLRVSVLSSGRALDMTGAGVFGYFIRADEETVVITGSAQGDTATVVLPEACYAVPGRFSLIVKVSLADGAKAGRKAVFWGEGYVTRASSDVLVDPGGVVPSLEELLARIAEMERATEAAYAAAGTAKDAAKGADAAAGRADGATRDAQDATGEARALTDRFSQVDVRYEVLPPSSDPWAGIEQSEKSTTFRFGLPTSNLAYSTFEVDNDMQLMMTSPDGFSDIGFELTDDGDLEVVIP